MANEIFTCPTHQVQLVFGGEGINKNGNPYTRYDCAEKRNGCTAVGWGRPTAKAAQPTGSQPVAQNTKSGLEIVLTEVVNVNRKLDALNKLIEERTDFICNLINDTAIK